MLNPAQRERLHVVLVSPRNPLNIGAVARAMANFGFSRLSVAAPYAPHWREAKSAVGAPQLLADAQEFPTLHEAVAHCTYIAGTGTLAHRKPDQPIVSLPNLTPIIERELFRGGRAALVLGPEKHGLTRDDLSWCHVLVEIPTDPQQPSMNLGQAAAVCLYELARPTPTPAAVAITGPEEFSDELAGVKVPSESLDRLATLIEETMTEVEYSPSSMAGANRHDVRVMLRKLQLSALDTRRILGLFRCILRRLSKLPASK